MNKPKSTTIEITESMTYCIAAVHFGKSKRVAVPGQYKVWREGGKIFLEVFHND